MISRCLHSSSIFINGVQFNSLKTDIRLNRVESVCFYLQIKQSVLTTKTKHLTPFKEKTYLYCQNATEHMHEDNA